MKARTFNGTVLDVRAAAAYLGGSERSLRWHVARGLVPYRKLGGRIVFKRVELETFVDDLPGITLAQARRNAAKRKA